MITFFRRFFQSKIGIAVTLAFLGLIAFAFASMDVANTATFGGVAGGDRVATVGDKRISTSDLDAEVRTQLSRLRQENPTLTMEQIVAEGGVEQILDQLLQGWAIADYAEAMGLRAGSRLIDSEITAIPGLRAADGTFDQNAFRNALNQRGLSEDGLREDIMLSLLAQQTVLPASQGAKLPQGVLDRYAGLLGETRRGVVASLPAADYAPTGVPGEGVIAAYYRANIEDYRRPERRVLRYGTFDVDVLGELPAPPAAAIQRRYQRDASVYAARELRSFTQLIAPTQAAAQAVVDEVRSGVSLEQSARSKGLTTTTLSELDRSAISGRASAAVAQAGFAASRGSLSTPAQSGLGWYVLRVDDVQQIAGQSLAQATPVITQQLVEETRRNELNELTSRIEDEIADGRSLSEVADDLGVELVTTPPLLASGQVYGKQEAAPQILMPAISVGFEMDEGDPQLGEIAAGEEFLIFDVAEITPSAIAPLSEIAERVESDWRTAQGMKAAAAAATRVRDKVRGGMTLAAAIEEESPNLLAPAPITLSREQFEEQARAAQGNVPRPLSLMFAMAKGTVKRTQQPQTDRWFVVQLQDITPGRLAGDNALSQQVLEQLRETAAQEISAQYIAGIESTMDAEINQDGLDAVIDQLTGRSS